MNEYLIKFLDDNGYVDTMKVFGQSADQVWEQFRKDRSGCCVISVNLA